MTRSEGVKEVGEAVVLPIEIKCGEKIRNDVRLKFIIRHFIVEIHF